jgi:hypothetical protein
MMEFTDAQLGGHGIMELGNNSADRRRITRREISDRVDRNLSHFLPTAATACGTVLHHLRNLSRAA